MRDGWKVGLIVPLALLLYGCGGRGVEQAVLEGRVTVPEEQAARRDEGRLSPLDILIPRAYADIRGVPLPSAQVKAINPATDRILATTETDSNGYYRIPGLPVDIVVQVVAEKSAAPGALRLAAFARTQRGTKRCDLDEHTTVAAKALELAKERVEEAGGNVSEGLKHLDIYERIKESAEQAGLVPILSDEASVTEKASQALT
ncbi:MAG TPA: carboxypeptidase regulatory-like domain-containing protein, partial [Armatimonadetes bacterium]|nr:carboxypeptidase regulatory-like domain-containing protein [Armatimonadota bacterium]